MEGECFKVHVKLKWEDLCIQSNLLPQTVSETSRIITEHRLQTHKGAHTPYKGGAALMSFCRLLFYPYHTKYGSQPSLQETAFVSFVHE